MKKYSPKIYLILIIGVGLLLRIWGSDWGFPLILHPDEPIIVEQSYELIKRNSYEPLRNYGTPDQLSIYLNRFIFEIISPIRFSGRPVIETFETNRFFYYQTARVVTGVIGVVSVYLAYLIGLEFSLSAGLIAALLFSLFPQLVIHSHYATPDVPITTLTLLTIYLSMIYLRSKNKKYIKYMSIVAAASVAEKYPGFLNLCMFGLVILIVNFKTWNKLIIDWLKLSALFLLSLLVIAPFLIIRIDRVVAGIKFESGSSHLGIELLGIRGNLEFYIKTLYDNSGVILITFIILGLIHILRNRHLKFIPLFLGMIYWISLSILPLHWERWGLPMFVSPLLIAAIGLDSLLNKSIKYQKVLLIAAFLFSCTALTFYDWLSVAKLLAPDTRVIALDYLSSKNITSKNSIYEGYTPFSPGVTGNTKYNINELNDKNKKYFILSSSLYNRYLVDRKLDYSKNIAFYNKVTNMKLTKEFKPHCDIKKANSIFPEIEMLSGRVSENCTVGPTLKVYSK